MDHVSKPAKHIKNKKKLCVNGVVNIML